MTRKRTAVLVACLALALGASASAAGLAGTNGPSATNYLLLFSAIVAAVGGVVSAIVTVTGNASAATEQRRLAKGQAAMAEDIKLLTELTQTSLEEARAQRPAPSVELLLRDGTSATAGGWRREIDRRALDVETIMAAQRAAALATVPRSSEPTAVGAMPEQVRAHLLALQLLGGGQVTVEDRASFESTVDEYLDRLRRWLETFETWRNIRRRMLVVPFRVANSGRVPASDVRVHVHFPVGFVSTSGPPTIDAPPPRPRFRQRGFLDFSTSSLGLGRLAALRMPAITPINQNVTGPYYRDGSLLVEFKIKKLLHGIPEDTKDPALVLIDSDGTYSVPWEIHADNIAEPVRGELTIKLESTVTQEPAITSLEDVIASLPPGIRSNWEDV